MSADNWATCPRCRRLEEVRIAGLQRQVAESYGVLPVEQYDALRGEAAEPINRSRLVTFREDYEIWGAEEGKIMIRYTGICNVCGLAAEFCHAESFYS